MVVVAGGDDGGGDFEDGDALRGIPLSLRVLRTRANPSSFPHIPFPKFISLFSLSLSIIVLFVSPCGGETRGLIPPPPGLIPTSAQIPAPSFISFLFFLLSLSLILSKEMFSCVSCVLRAMLSPKCSTRARSRPNQGEEEGIRSSAVAVVILWYGTTLICWLIVVGVEIVEGGVDNCVVDCV